jgi:hypothetical protein
MVIEGISMTKAEAWELIKTEAPEMAEFMTDVTKAFGRSTFTVEIDGELILRDGEVVT